VLGEQETPDMAPPKDYEKHNLNSNTALSSLDPEVLLQAIQASFLAFEAFSEVVMPPP
jgi:hypothetical protein